MKTNLIIGTFFIIKILYSQSIDFDIATNWIQGSGSFTSYQTDHKYNTQVAGFNVEFTGGPALRETQGTQDGFDKTYNNSTYAWRLRDQNTVEWFANLFASSINGFSFYVRRWDGSPSPDFDVSFSTDNGISWISIGTINNTFLGNSSDWKLFSYNNSITSEVSKIIIRVKANGTTERIMIDDFNFDNPTPVELMAFKYFHRGNNIILNWSTATETQNYGWEIERSVINKETNKPSVWQTIGFVKGSGNSNSPKEYSFIDNTALYGEYAYRLKQIDIDGTTSYSDELRVFVGQKPQVYDLKPFPNPMNPVAKIRYEVPEYSLVNISIYDITGRLIKTLINENKEPGIYEIEFDGRQLASGIYLSVLRSNGITITRKVQLIK